MFFSPTCDRPVIAAQENSGDFQSPKLSGPCVLGILHHSLEPLAERFLEHTLRVSQRPGEMADNRLHDRQGRYFSSCQHVRPDGERAGGE